MPVEIRELIIRAVVTEDQEGAEGAPAAQLEEQDQNTMDSIVAACVKQVLHILRKSKER